ncbi:MAG: electron transport complex subunit RsxG [Zoogloeaceae bacterium]|jgi:electron transport complex protein RnfG|nr:electron transport complex subunit RsxG [Zoogloeaceae bacterium]
MMDLETLKSHALYPPLLLGCVALLASASLALAASATREAIREAEARDLRDSLAQVLPAGYADNDLLADSAQVETGRGAPLTIYRAKRDGVTCGAVFRVYGKGYGGEIVILMAVDQEGVLLGARVLKHTETPGLGDKIEAAKSDWIGEFSGKSLATARWAVKKDGGDFDQFAGATITPRAVVNAVHTGLETFRQHQSAILGRPADGNFSSLSPLGERARERGEFFPNETFSQEKEHGS